MNLILKLKREMITELFAGIKHSLFLKSSEDTSNIFRKSPKVQTLKLSVTLSKNQF